MTESTVETSTETILDVAKTGRIRVLHVDDDQAFLKVAKQCLEMQGEIDVDTVSSVNEASEKLKKTDYAAIVCDYQMPGKDGLEFLKELRAGGNTIPFIVFTGKGREEVAIKALNLGADRYVDKHGDPETVYCELAHAIRQATDRKSKEIELFKKEAELQAVLESSPDAITVSDLNGNVIQCNKATLDMLGFSSKDELIGKNGYELIAEKDRQKATENLKKTLDQGSVRNIEYAFLTRDGHEFPAELSVSVLRDSSGKVVGFVSVAKNISERKKAEEKLLKSSEEWKRTFDAISDIVFILDTNFRFVRVNKALCNTLKKEPRELIGKHCYEVLHGIDRPWPNCPHKKTLSTGQAATEEVNDPHLGCSLLIANSPIFDDSGKLIGAVHSAKNITERKHAEEVLRLSEEKFRTIVESIQDVVMLTLPNGIISYLSPACSQVLGYQPEELVGKRPWISHPDDLEKLKAAHFDALKGKKGSDFEYRIITKTGQTRWISHSWSPIITNGQVKLIASAVVDITERKKAEEALRESEEKWRSLAENAPNVIVVVDRDGTIQFINRTVIDARPEEIVGKSIYDFIDPEHHDVVKKTIEQVFQAGEGGRYEISGVGPKGNVSWYETHVGPIKRNGQVASVTLITTDFTERKKEEHALLESQQKFERLFEGIPEATAFVDVNDCVLDLNPRFSQLFGYSVDEAKGKPLDDLIVPNDKKKEAKMLTENSKEGYVLFETVRKTKDGSLVPVSISAAPISVEGQHVGDVVLYQDITRRKQTEEALRKSEEKFRNLFDRANDAIMYLDRYGRILDVNGRAVEMFGGTREELIGKQFAKIGIFSIKETPVLMRNFADVLAGKKVNLNVSFKNKKGQEIALECSVSLVKTDEFAGIVVIARDISERQKAEEELRTSEERLSVLFELAPDAYYLNDLKGNFVDGNKAAEEVTGYMKNELIGKSFLKLKLLPRSQALKAAKLLVMNALGKPTGPDEFVLNRKDGTQVPVEIRTYPVRIKGKTLVLGIARDISIRRKNEQAVRESQQKFEGLFSHNPEAAVYLDLNFKIMGANPRFCQLFGYSAKEVEGKHINEVVAPEGMIEEAERLDKDAKNGYANHDTVRKRKDGSLVHVSISAAPVIIEDKQLGYVGVYKDITNLKDAEERLREMNKRLEVTNEKLHVVGGLTRHDVRNKLVAVTGNAYLLRQKLVGDAKALGQLNDMEAAVRLVEEIFEFARIYEKLGVEQLTSMDVGKAVEGAVSLFSGLKGVKMVNECRGLTVLADSLLSQLFYNLIDNSLKYGEKTRQIKVYCKTSSLDQLELVYEDDGVGIPDNMRSNLFKEGFTSGKGTGYGLFMIKRICEVYGWTIQEKGTQGKGTRFILTVPQQRAH